MPNSPNKNIAPSAKYEFDFLGHLINKNSCLTIPNLLCIICQERLQAMTLRISLEKKIRQEIWQTKHQVQPIKWQKWRKR